MADYASGSRGYHRNSPHRPGKRAKGAPKPVADLVAQVVKQGGFKGSSKLDRLRAVWREAVGQGNAAETRLAGFRGGVLVVETRSAALAQELSVYYKRDLLLRLKEKTGLPVHDLRCRVVGQQGSPSRPE